MAGRNLELWRVKDVEGMAIARLEESGRMPPVDELRPGDYVLCDEGGNLLKVSVRDASDERVPGVSRHSGVEVGEPPF